MCSLLPDMPSSFKRMTVIFMTALLFLVQIPQDVMADTVDTVIRDGILYSCYSAEEIYTVPDTVVIIASGAFHSGTLKKVVIPGCVRKIQAGAFQACSSIRTVVFMGETEIDSGAFVNSIPVNLVGSSENIKTYGKQCGIPVTEDESVKMDAGTLTVERGLTKKFFLLNAEDDSAVPENGSICSVSDGMVKGLKKGSTYLCYANVRVGTVKVTDKTGIRIKKMASGWKKLSMKKKLKKSYTAVIKRTSYDNSSVFDGTFTGQASTAYGALVKKKAVCAGYADAFYQLISWLGADVRKVIGTREGEGHAWNKVRYRKKWYIIDCTLGDCGKDADFTYFLITQKKAKKMGYRQVSVSKS